MDEFSSVGVIFAQGTLRQSEFFDGNPENHFITSTPPVAFLTVPVFGMTIESNSFWNATLTAFDANNAILGTATLLNATPGISPRRGVLSVNSRVPINQFSVLPPEAGEILNLDNLVLTPDAVPEPTTLTLIGIGALVAGARRARATHPRGSRRVQHQRYRSSGGGAGPFQDNRLSCGSLPRSG